MLFQLRFIVLGCVISLFNLACSTSTDNDLGKTDLINDIRVSDGYQVELVADRELLDFPMFATLDMQGRLFVFESTGNVYEESEDALEDPKFRIKLLEDEDGDGFYDKSTIYADTVGFPQGGVFYKGSLYASSAPDLIKFTDTDGDGIADKREIILTGWTLNVNANSLVGPFMSPDGWLYMTSAIMGFDVTTREGERLQGETSRIWRVRPDGSDLEWISAGGMNNPVELTFTSAGEPIGTETYFTNPKAGQRDALVYWVKGGVYPKPNNNIARDDLVLTGDLMPVVSKYSRVSPAGIGRYRSSVFGDEYKDNLFSAQFNTHRVLRHKLIREGGSFRTEDEVFFISDNEDFHPTDVLEDGDGSLLIVETGGWFIKGCPLSQVSKPELKGGIYRVRKKGTDRAKDPYGNSINWDKISIKEAIDFINDSRPFVADRAVQSVVESGAEAVEQLTKKLQSSSNSDFKTRVVFALYQIGTQEALRSMRAALEDEDPEVQVAAARSVGLAKDTEAVNSLMKLVLKSQELHVRRQAATALGQIGDAQAATALLEASRDVTDRFLSHAITYALISIDQPKLVEAGLTSNSTMIQSTSLKVLDQMEKSTLSAQTIMPFLNSDVELLQKTGLWVASHHPEWSDDMIAFLSQRFRKGDLSNTEMKLFGDLLISFCGNNSIQRFMVEELRKSSSHHQLFLMDVMAKCNIEDWPQIWVDGLGRQLNESHDIQVLNRILELIRLRNIPSLMPQLKKMADKNGVSSELRIEILAAIVSLDPALSDNNFNFLYSQLQQDVETPVRQRAASLLADSRLSVKQIQYLAMEYLDQADAFIMPRLLPAFKGSADVNVGKKLLSKLMESPGLDNYSEESIETVFAEYPEEINPLVDQLMTKLHEKKADRLEYLKSLESEISKGDLERGRELFFGKAICSTCHTLGNEGISFGPDLTSIQKDRSAHDILEALVYPSVSFVREYESYLIVTMDREYRGIIQQQTPDAIVVGTAPQTSVRISKEDILSTEITDVSMMPQGLDQLLTKEEMADLMTFILGQDQNPMTDQELLR